MPPPAADPRSPRWLAAVALLCLLALSPAQADGVAAAGSGGAVWPLDPRPPVVRAFAAPTSPWGPGHRGVDLLGRPGQAVRAAAAGRVSFAGRLAGRGVVVVDHGAVRTTYEPVAADVAVGDVVGAGQPIGRLELAASHCFPRACLHWGLLRGTTYLDPLTLVGAGPLRLLPLAGAPVGPGAPLLGWRRGPPALRLWGARGGMPAAVAPR